MSVVSRTDAVACTTGTARVSRRIHRYRLVSVSVSGGLSVDTLLRKSGPWGWRWGEVQPERNGRPQYVRGEYHDDAPLEAHRITLLADVVAGCRPGSGWSGHTQVDVRVPPQRSCHLVACGRGRDGDPWREGRKGGREWHVPTPSRGPSPVSPDSAVLTRRSSRHPRSCGTAEASSNDRRGSFSGVSGRCAGALTPLSTWSWAQGPPSYQFSLEWSGIDPVFWVPDKMVVVHGGGGPPYQWRKHPPTNHYYLLLWI